MNLKSALLSLSTVCTIGTGIAVYNSTPEADEFAAATDPEPDLDDPKSVERFMTNISTPCSPNKQTLLDESDAIIVTHQDQIRRWYNAICKFAQNSEEFKGKCPPLPQALFDSYKDPSFKRFCAQNNIATTAAVTVKEAVSLKEYGLTSIFPNTFSETEKRGDICILLEAEFHERVHAITHSTRHEAENHNQRGREGKLDPIYIADRAAKLVCIDSKSQPNPNDTEDDRYKKATATYFQRRIETPLEQGLNNPLLP